MATIMSQLNFIMMDCKRHDRVLGFPSCRTRQVTPINLVSTSSFKFTNHNNYNSMRLSTAYHCTSSGLQENYTHTNNDGGDLFATAKFTTMKPGVDNRNFVDTMSRILASLLTYGVVFTFVTLAACLYTSNSALAASYGRIGGSSSSSSSGKSSSSYGQSSVSYYLSDDDDADYLEEEEETCTCDISCSHCTHCISCEIREKGYKQDEEEEGNNSCSCNCHSTCYFHKQVDQDYLTLACFILVLIAIITAPFLEDKKKH